MGNDGSDIQAYLAQKTGQRTVPSIFINGVHVGGNSELVALNNKGGKFEIPLEASPDLVKAAASLFCPVNAGSNVISSSTSSFRAAKGAGGGGSGAPVSEIPEISTPPVSDIPRPPVLAELAGSERPPETVDPGVVGLQFAGGATNGGHFISQASAVRSLTVSTSIPKRQSLTEHLTMQVGIVASWQPIAPVNRLPLLKTFNPRWHTVRVWGPTKQVLPPAIAPLSPSAANSAAPAAADASRSSPRGSPAASSAAGSFAGSTAPVSASRSTAGAFLGAFGAFLGAFGAIY